MKHVARKRFGQNFLVDQNVIRQILDALAIHEGDVIVEIGPGLGALTVPLLDALDGALLHVVEIDRDLAAALRKHRLASRLVVHETDALQFDFAALGEAGKALRIVGNLPYNISSPLLFHLREVAEKVTDQHFMLQREVVERLVARPGESAYGRLSVMLQVRYAMTAVLDVSPEAFDPQPKVHSAVVRMVPLAAERVGILDAQLFAELVRQAFSQRRKMLRNTLAGFDRLLPMSDFGLDPSARAETIAPETFVAYANALHGLEAMQQRPKVSAGEALPRDAD